ncbi:MAG: M43 family zinc metalloprotease [Bacteroidia bacterium]
MRSTYFKSILLSAVAGYANLNTAFSQETTIPCGTVEHNQALYKEHPDLEQAYIDYNNTLNQNMAQKSERSTTLYTIPIVFHVIHIDGTENVSDANIVALVNRINTDYRKLNTDISLCPPSFQAIAGDAIIQFKLAQLDPNGNCTNGIERIYSHKTLDAGERSKLNQWPREKYCNVWVINTLEVDPGTVGLVLAYATFPSSVNTYGFPSDGVIMRSDQVNGTSRTLTHELGHWMSLEHTWGGGTVATACGDDGVADTPETKGHFSTCPAYDSTCVPGVLENVNNYMDYSSCVYMFTQNQVDRMRTALESTVSQRSNLWLASNLAATGTDGGTYPKCAPTSDFYSNKTMVCPGTSVIFTPNVLNSSVGTTNTYDWDFGDGSAHGTTASPSHTYSTPGGYSVSLTVTNSGGGTGATVTKTNYIYVSDNFAQVNSSFVENFENSASFWSKWIVNDLDHNSRTWNYSSAAGYLSSHSAMMNGYYGYRDDVDQLISPSYNLSFMTGVTMTFRCAAATNATQAVDINDALKVYSSVDCGGTWQLRKTFSGTALLNDSYHPEEFIPSSAGEWALQTVNIPSSVCTGNTRFKFEYTTGSESNSIFIDDIMINGVTGIDEPIEVNSVSLYPNPANQSTTLTYHVNKKGNTKIELIDILGKKLMEVDNTAQAEGDYTVEISKDQLHLLNGIYFVKVSLDNQNIITKKLIITE